MAKKQKVKCLTCKNAKLMQWGNDPIISECFKGMNVANSVRICDSYELDKHHKEIEKKVKDW